MKSNRDVFAKDISGNTLLHLACQKGNEEDICMLLDDKANISLYLENLEGLPAIFCIPDISVRNSILHRYPNVLDAFANKLIVILRIIISEKTEQYTEYRKNSLFKFGFYRAKQFDRDIEMSMDPFEKAVNILEEMLCCIINHLERTEGYYGFTHRGNLYSHSQDSLLINAFYMNKILRKALNLQPLDTQSLHLSEYRESLRTTLLVELKELQKLVWSMILPDVINDFMLI